VGKVVEIDEESRFRYDYVRLKIACRDVSKVPKTVEGTLGMYIIDFEFEREVPEGKGERMLKSGIKVGEEAQPPPKRSKANNVSDSQRAPDTESNISEQPKQDQGKSSGKQAQAMYWSAPPKIDFNRRSQSKLMADAQKAFSIPNVGEASDRVHIPDTLEDSDYDVIPLAEGSNNLPMMKWGNHPKMLKVIPLSSSSLFRLKSEMTTSLNLHSKRCRKTTLLLSYPAMKKRLFMKVVRRKNNPQKSLSLRTTLSTHKKVWKLMITCSSLKIQCWIKMSQKLLTLWWCLARTSIKFRRGVKD